MTLATAILAILAYTHQFEYPLTIAQIWQRLAVTANDRTLPHHSHPQVEQAVAKLVATKKLEQRGEYYFLPGQRQLVTVRQARARRSAQKWREVARCVSLMSWIPWLTAMFVTGSLAMNNAIDNDDVDFLFVTTPGRLWLTRILVTVLALVAGKRRSWRGEEQNSWCFNLWLDEEHLAVETDRRRLYQAYEVIQAVPVAGVPGVIEQFYTQNAWVKKWLPNWSGRYQPVTITLKARVLKRSQPSAQLQPIWNTLENWAYHFQQWYMQPHQTTERVGRGFAFFHPRDTERLILQGWHHRKENPDVNAGRTRP